MTQEEKQLLLVYLCARLPSGVKFACNKNIYTAKGLDLIVTDEGDWEYAVTAKGIAPVEIDLIKPYLFPLSSMTEEQKQEYTYIVNYISSDDTENWVEGEFIYVEQFTQLMHFYHINHLDYMGLIPMGLAIDATGLNIY